VSDAIDKHDLATEKRRLLAETRADLLKRQLSNAENYDKAVLSLSTAFLGFSLAFLKDLAPDPSSRMALFSLRLMDGPGRISPMYNCWLMCSHRAGCDMIAT
jgi:hypothetical protein